MAETMSFEAAIARLDEIVRGLERGDAPLDASLALFKEGTALIASCSKMLDEAEQTVVQLTKNSDGSLSETAFDGEDA